MSAIDSGHGSDSGYVAEARDDERRIAPSEAADGDDLATDSNDESDVDEDVEGSDRPETPEFRAPLPHQRAPPPEGTPLSPPRPMPQTLPASPSSTVAPPQTAPAVAPENNLANSDVMVKYRTAADIANDVLRRVVEVVRPGSRVVELCAYGDSLILESASRVFKKSGVEKGIAKPTSIAVNNCLSNYAALEDDLQVLHHGDMVKIELAVHIDGYVAAAAHTTMINPRPDQPVVGKAADAVCAAYFGLEVALRTLKAGSKVSEVTTALNKVAQAFKCHAAIEPGHRAVAQVRRNVLEVREPKKRSNASGGAPSSPSRVPQSTATQAPQSVANSGQEAAKLPVQGANPGTGVNAGSAGSTAEQPPKPATSQSRSKEEDHVFEAGQVWTINVLMSSGDGKVKERSDLKPTVYQRNSNKTFNLKLKVSRTVFNEIQKRFGTFPFTLRALEDKRSRLGILECVQHNLLEPYPIYFDNSTQFIAQFKCTVIIPPNSTMPLRITSCPPLPYVHSEFSILNDRDMGTLLKTQIKTVSNGTILQLSPITQTQINGSVGKSANHGPPSDKEIKKVAKHSAGQPGSDASVNAAAQA